MCQVKEKTSETKKKIIVSALSLLAENGYKASTTREIAKLAEVNETTIFKNFGNKRSLFIAAFETNLDEMMQTIEQVIREKNVDYKDYIRRIAKEVYAIMNQYQSIITITMREIGNPELNLNKNTIFERIINGIALQLAGITKKESVIFVSPVYMLVSSLIFTVINEQNEHLLLDDLQCNITVDTLAEQAQVLIERVLD